MILFHHNFGYPLVSERSKMVTSPGDIKALNAQKELDNQSKIEISDCKVFERPSNCGELAYIYDFKPDNEGNVYAGIINYEKEFGCYLKISKDQFKQVIEWKMMNMGEYVVGIEPTNGQIYGRGKARERGEIDFIYPGEKKNFNIEVCVLQDKNEIKDYESIVKY